MESRLFFGVGIGGISVAAGAAAGGFALTASPFFKRRSAGPAKRNQKALPRRSAPRWGSGFLRYGIAPGAAATACFAAPPSAVYDFVVRSLRSHTRIDPFTQPSEGAKDQKPDQDQKPEQNQKPLTLALSRREREPTVVDVGDTLTWDIELNAQFEKHENRPPLPRERAGVRGESKTNPKPSAASNHSTMSASSSALDLA
ncbi:hypothetical protein SAMN05216496_4601 [Pseudomonas sp. Z003-0.4C(8344-21)]|nr:hypothetical protein SAMN05216496_4601 [Pseudomonas sp. Z003-0.4C(8344-21)]